MGAFADELTGELDSVTAAPPKKSFADELTEDLDSVTAPPKVAAPPPIPLGGSAVARAPLAGVSDIGLPGAPARQVEPPTTAMNAAPPLTLGGRLSNAATNFGDAAIGATDGAASLLGGMAQAPLDIWNGVVGPAGGHRIADEPGVDAPPAEPGFNDALKSAAMLAAPVFPPAALAVGAYGGIRGMDEMRAADSPEATGRALADTLGSAAMGVHGALGMPASARAIAAPTWDKAGYPASATPFGPEPPPLPPGPTPEDPTNDARWNQWGADQDAIQGRVDQARADAVKAPDRSAQYDPAATGAPKRPADLPPVEPYKPQAEYDTHAGVVEGMGADLKDVLERRARANDQGVHDMGMDVVRALHEKSGSTGRDLIEELRRRADTDVLGKVEDLVRELEPRKISAGRSEPSGFQPMKDAPAYPGDQADVPSGYDVTDVPPAPTRAPQPAPAPGAPAGGKIWPELPPMDRTGRELAEPGRHVNASDVGLKRATATGNILSATEARRAAAGAPIAEGTGGTGIADLMAEGKARARQRAEGFTKNVLQGIEKKFPEGSDGDLAAARFIEGKATTLDMDLLRQNPDLMAAAERWQQGAKEALDNPEMDVRGHIQDYLSHARSLGQSPTVLDFFNDLERGSGGSARMQNDPLTSYMQRARSPGEVAVPPSLVRAARAYGKAGGFQMDVKPLLKDTKAFLERKAPDGSPIFDGADRKFVENYLNDAVLGREQPSEAAVRQSLAKPTAYLNKALSTVGLPTVDNPLGAAVKMARRLADITLVRPGAAAVSHFLGDVWPKFAEKGVGGIKEYVEGADRALRTMSDGEWDRLERLGVANRLPMTESTNPVMRGLSQVNRYTIGAATTVDTISKVGSFYSDLKTLMDKGIPEAQAESMAGTLARAKNYYSTPENSIPLSTGRVAGTFYQFLKPGLNSMDNMRNWMEQGNGRAFVRTGIGAAGLYVLGQAVGADLLHRVHMLPNRATPAIQQMGDKMLSSIERGEPPDLMPGILKSDPFGVGTEEDKEASKKEAARDPETKRQRNIQSYNRRVAKKRNERE